MKKYMIVGGLAAVAATVYALAVLLTPLCVLDLSAYESYEHDLTGNTLAADVMKSAGVVTGCTLVVFDKKGQEKARAPFAEGIDASNVSVKYFDKSWGVLLVTGSTDIYYSVKISKATVTVQGTANEFAMNFEYGCKQGILSYFNSTKTAQLFDPLLQPLGGPQVLSDDPQPLNYGAYFHCSAGNVVQVWRLKKGLEKVVQDSSNVRDESFRYNALNEAKYLICIESNDVHRIYNYK